ncbi:hypothetical protein [Jannaschia sp. 2305UL9-9]|uniref:hypothetical protein n=1 Tax=Jannaschia sp. 2305UL9-9 TaxID=3121638 RepID=UPI003528E870
MIPRSTVAAALGLPADTDTLPPGDLPLDRFMERYVQYLGTEDAATDTPDAWTGAVMDHLIANDPDLAFTAIRAGLPLDSDGLLADALADLGEQPGMKSRIEEAAQDDADLAARLDTGD